MKIGIVGIGFVGGSMLKSFEEKGISCFTYDKFKNIGSLENVLDTDLLFLCLPTLFDEEKNNYNKDEIRITLQNIKNYKGLVILKSTIEPETTDTFSKEFPYLKICHNPEFLTARTAFEDFHNQKHIVIGKGKNCDSVEILINFYKQYYPEAEISVCKSIESESMKIFCNSFYASKVMIFNEFYLLCQKNGSDFKIVRDLMLKNNWINPMHTIIPGTDGQLGYGGACFPKDTKALNEYMKKNNSPNKVLDNIIDECEKIRNN